LLDQKWLAAPIETSASSSPRPQRPRPEAKVDHPPLLHLADHGIARTVLTEATAAARDDHCVGPSVAVKVARLIGAAGFCARAGASSRASAAAIIGCIALSEACKHEAGTCDGAGKRHERTIVQYQLGFGASRE
jgi:hypothetical protein